MKKIAHFIEAREPIWILKVPVLHSNSASFAFQKCQFCVPKVPVLQRKMVRFTMQNGAFCNHDLQQNRLKKARNGTVYPADIQCRFGPWDIQNGMNADEFPQPRGSQKLPKGARTTREKRRKMGDIYGMQRLSSAWNKGEKNGQRPVCRCKDNMQPHLFASFNIVFCVLFNTQTL